MSEGARVVRERGVSVLLFPEGGRSPHGLREFKEGAAYIAIKAGVPAVPIALVGMRRILPMGSIHIRAGRARAARGRPDPHRGLTIAGRAALNQTAVCRGVPAIEAVTAKAPSLWGRRFRLPTSSHL